MDMEEDEEEGEECCMRYCVVDEDEYVITTREAVKRHSSAKDLSVVKGTTLGEILERIRAAVGTREGTDTALFALSSLSWIPIREEYLQRRIDKGLYLKVVRAPITEISYGLAERYGATKLEVKTK
ncbi:hypothetical protein SELMODRAFT_427005 [Selaginella moellendorffii]|uniref:Uncharacterized protein n=1 Tax=Selaginella moellendorffii TaxID=88036 RepID=D8SY76_SELML|nr:hypothetical protein SELMODRAFT_427005 [Selaginella moellendorffii]